MKKERGVSLSGLIVVIAILMVVLLIGFKLFNPYMEYFKIEKAFKSVAGNPEFKNATPKEIQSSFWKFAAVDNIKSISMDDIDVDKSTGDVVLSANYSVKVPLVANISLVVDFAPTSAH